MIIYKTTNLINGKFYIGKDMKNDSTYFGSGLKLKRAIKKYAIENFKKEILEECSSEKELNEKEIYWIKFTNAIENGYNIAEGGTGGKTLKNPINKGKTLFELYGEKKSLEIKEKLSNSHKGKKQSEETKNKRALKLKGKKQSEETKLKRSISNSGNLISENTKTKISNTLKEYFKNNPEIKKKMSDRRKDKKASDTTKLKISKNIKESYKNGKHKKPKKHQCCRIWSFYNNKNEKIFEHIGNYNNFCTENKISIRHTKKFFDINDCFSYNNKSEYKVYWIKFWDVN